MEKIETKNTMNSNVEIVQFAAKKWKLLFVIGAIAGVFAYVFSLPQFIPPKFKSEAVIYPANLGAYAEENGLEQMQQYLESNELRNHIIAKFNLYDDSWAVVAPIWRRRTPPVATRLALSGEG